MKLISLAFLLASALSLTQASPVIARDDKKPPYFFLIGDSTVAEGAGWGNGLLAYLKDPAVGENRAKSGSTTASWKSNGRWESLLEDIEANADDYEPIVTMQFGHNDQKGLTLDEYRANLVGLVEGIKEAGGHPIIITPLTRRNWEDGKVIEDFATWRGKGIAVAKEESIVWLDLTTKSTDYVNAIGEENANTYDYDGDDATHLSPAGQAVFGRMVLDLLLAKRDDLDTYFESNEELSDLIANNEFATGDE